LKSASAQQEKRGGDWQPWVILALLLTALAVVVWLKHRPGPELAKRTAQTGLPLSPEQRSVDFVSADLTFDVQPNDRRIDGVAILGFVVKARISKLQFDLDPELPISAIAADGRVLPRSAWENNGGLVTVTLSGPVGVRPDGRRTSERPLREPVPAPSEE